MKASNRLTDEQLARLVEAGFGLTPGDGFTDFESFEAVNVAAKALEIMEDNVTLEFSDFNPAGIMAADFGPVAMCGFLGDDGDMDIDGYENDHTGQTGDDTPADDDGGLRKCPR